MLYSTFTLHGTRDYSSTGPTAKSGIRTTWEVRYLSLEINLLPIEIKRGIYKEKIG